MAGLTAAPARIPGRRHPALVRVTHWIHALAFGALAVSGAAILIAHPRFYWGETGYFDTPAAFALPLTVNLDQTGWGRSLHFLAAWCLVVPGLVYLFRGITAGHFRAHLWPDARELSPTTLWPSVVDHARLRIPPATGGPRYNVLQKLAYSWVVFVAAPLMVLTGLAMSPAIGAALPWLPRLFGGYQSARTVHFVVFVALVLFVVVHLVMVVASGFRRQMRAMTFPAARGVGD